MSDAARQRPYLAVYGVFRRDGAVLLTRRANTGFADGFWGLPAGHVDEGEEALAALSREMCEELGVAVAQDDWRHLVTMHRRSDRLGLDLFFEATRWRGTPEIREPEKCDGLEWRALDRLGDPDAGPVIDYVRFALRPDAPAYAQWGWAD